MPFARPSYSDLRRQASEDVASGLPGADALLRFSNLKVIAEVQAALANGQYGYLDWIARQSNPFTATGEFADAWGGLIDVVRKEAVKATGARVFTGADGLQILADAEVVRSDGFAYRVTADATVAGGEATVSLEALSAGAGGNADAGVALTLSQAVAGIVSTSTAGGAIAGGAEVEDDDAYRTRYLAAYAAPAQGGADSDYEQWALDVPGVTRAWVPRPGPSGPGTVTVYFMMDEVRADDGGFPDGDNGVAADETRDIAATGDQLLVADAIWPLQPVSALVYACAPARNTVVFTISLPGASPAIKAAVDAAIDDVFTRKGAPGGKIDLILVNGALAALSGVAGLVITDIACDHGAVSPGDNGNITSDIGCLPVRGVTLWP